MGGGVLADTLVLGTAGLLGAGAAPVPPPLPHAASAITNPMTPIKPRTTAPSPQTMSELT
ncbi:hypothetical protein GCM10020216_092020 [Nonomuraea helvata]